MDPVRISFLAFLNLNTV